MLAVLESAPISWRIRADLARAAIDAHVHPLIPSTPPVLAALVAGVAWIAAGLASAVQPLMPDWPGFLSESLPIGVLGAVAALRAVTAMGRRSGLDAPRGTTPAMVVAVLGHVAWITALLIAALGGPYGALTGAAGGIAAIGTILVGVVRSRAGDHPAAEGLMMAGGAMLIPSPVAWVLAGAAWLGIAVAGLTPAAPLRRA